jgi:hypothetical protein
MEEPLAEIATQLARIDTTPGSAYTRQRQLNWREDLEGRENRPRSRHCDRLAAAKEPRVRNDPGPVDADTLREKGCGDAPRYSRGAFLLELTKVSCEGDALNSLVSFSAC